MFAWKSENAGFITGHIRNGAGTFDEVFVRINAEAHCLWRAVDHGGEALKVFVTKHRDHKKISHQRFRRREKATVKFTDIGTLQKFASIHASVHNFFKHERHLNPREIFKKDCVAGLLEWRHFAAR